MAELLSIARPYAEAAFAAAVDQNSLHAWSDAIGRLAEVVKALEKFDVFGNPQFNAAQTAGLVTEAAGHLNAEQRNFVKLLADNQRLTVLPEISATFMHLRHQKERVIEAEVSSAFALTQAQTHDIRKVLEDKYQQKVEITEKVDPELIGGVAIRIGDEVIDASVRGKLAQLGQALKIQ